MIDILIRLVVALSKLVRLLIRLLYMLLQLIEALYLMSYFGRFSNDLEPQGVTSMESFHSTMP